jgi:hypothetical protein
MKAALQPSSNIVMGLILSTIDNRPGDDSSLAAQSDLNFASFPVNETKNRRRKEIK